MIGILFSPFIFGFEFSEAAVRRTNSGSFYRQARGQACSLLPALVICLARGGKRRLISLQPENRQNG